VRKGYQRKAAIGIKGKVAILLAETHTDQSASNISLMTALKTDRQKVKPK